MADSKIFKFIDGINSFILAGKSKRMEFEKKYFYGNQVQIIKDNIKNLVNYEFDSEIVYSDKYYPPSDKINTYKFFFNEPLLDFIVTWSVKAFKKL